MCQSATAVTWQELSKEIRSVDRAITAPGPPGRVRLCSTAVSALAPTSLAFAASFVVALSFAFALKPQVVRYNTLNYLPFAVAVA